MAYEKVKDLVKDLNEEELEIEDSILHSRKDKKNDKIIAKKMKDFGVLKGNHQKEEKCLCCNLLLSECPIKKDIINEEMRRQ